MKLTKEKLLEYFKDNFDVTLEQIFNDLKLDPIDLPYLEIYLEKLIEEKFVKKSTTLNGTYEYDPGEKLDFGGL